MMSRNYCNMHCEGRALELIPEILKVTRKYFIILFVIQNIAQNVFDSFLSIQMFCSLIRIIMCRILSSCYSVLSLKNIVMRGASKNSTLISSVLKCKGLRLLVVVVFAFPSFVFPFLLTTFACLKFKVSSCPFINAFTLELRCRGWMKSSSNTWKLQVIGYYSFALAFSELNFSLK